MIIQFRSTSTPIWGYSYVAEPHTECGHEQTTELKTQIFISWVQCNVAAHLPCGFTEEEDDDE